MRIAKEVVPTGTVRVRTSTESFEEDVGALLDRETYDIKRVPIGREVDAAPGIRTEGDLTIVPVLEEVLFVEKRLVLKEEIHLRRRVATDRVETPVTLRRQRAVTERLDSAGMPTPLEEESKDEEKP